MGRGEHLADSRFVGERIVTRRGEDAFRGDGKCRPGKPYLRERSGEAELLEQGEDALRRVPIADDAGQAMGGIGAVSDDQRGRLGQDHGMGFGVGQIPAASEDMAGAVVESASRLRE
jgi:hypothetical protein